jgi:endonuclease IV
MEEVEKVKADKLLEGGLVRKADTDPLVIKSLMAAAVSGLEGAVHTIEREPVKCFAQAYDAVYDACHAYMRGQGFRTVAENDHRVVLDYCGSSLGKEDAATIRMFESTEKRRHKEMYSGKHSIVAAEAAELVARARKLIGRIKDLTMAGQLDGRL